MKKAERSNRVRQEVVNFRTSSELVEALDMLAAKEHRTRANLIEWLLTQDTNIERPASAIALIVSSLYGEIEHTGTDRRKRIKKPFPHTVALAPDGKRYGWDSDADMDGP